MRPGNTSAGIDCRATARGRAGRWGLLLALLAADGAHAQTTTGRVVAVSDGDTLRVLVQGGQLKVRLAEIDAPEVGHGKKKPAQPHGGDARRALSSLVFGQTVRVEQQDRDRYGRVVGRVFVGPVDVNAALVRDGWAWVYRRYSRDPSLPPLEAAARAARRGLWAAPNPMPPWEWRRAGAATTPTRPAPVARTEGGQCAGKTRCGQMASCEEARFYLQSCGARRLDSDRDGMPCESLCR